MYYAIVGPGIAGVYDNWNHMDDLTHLFPYCKYRKFQTEEECWDFVYRYRYGRNEISLTKYGNTFDNTFVRMSYIIKDDTIYLSYNTKHIGNIRFDPIPGAIVEYTSNCVLVKIKTDKPIDNSTILSHLQVINRGVEILGDLIDVDIVVPDHSIYYALTAYTGKDEHIKMIKDRLENRLAGVSFSLYVK